MGRHEMDVSLLIGAPLGLGILLALGNFDGRDVLPLPIEWRRTNQIKIIHTQPTSAPHETSAAHCIGAGSSAVTALGKPPGRS